mgnify:CR=1 FL=1
MRITKLLLSLSVVGCAGEAVPSDSDSEDTSITDTQTDEDTGEVIDSGDVASLTGVPPKTPIPLPEFTATNSDGSARGPVDLENVRTVLWFYPAAGTPG